ncbi:uncharacterized protein LOC141692121 [Apium graveolens]|uniref:uncharacterized protein LOC141692121 n=1 Tax=Apium graveolens TaxID=4045 RepID=UPI003D7AA15B
MLKTFEEASGQKIDHQKSSVFFSRNVSNPCKQEICEVLRFEEADEGSHYLGLPNFIGRKKSAMSGYLKEKVRDSVQNWDGKMLSKGEMCGDMEKMMCKFWWRSSTKKDRSIHWMSWERMCQPKSVGGLGFRH